MHHIQKEFIHMKYMFQLSGIVVV